MAGLFGSKSQASQTPAVTGLQIQTSVYGKVIPVVYGETRLSGNLIWEANFWSFSSGGGKGGGKGGVLGGCFAGRTLISMAGNGLTQYKEIRDIQIGDKVQSYDPEHDDIREGTVTEVHTHRLNETPNTFILVVLENGGYVVPTDNHFFWRLDGTEVEIGHYREGDVVMMQDGSVQEIIAIRRDIPQATHSYNLTVEPHHNYFANRILVHNGGGGKSSKSTTYTVDCIIAICEGPVHAIDNLWDDKTYKPVGSVQFTAGIIPGSRTEGIWSYLNTRYPTQALTYNGTAKFVSAYLNLGSSGALPQFNFDVKGTLYGTAGNGIDADAAQVVKDILTNQYYGVGLADTDVGTIHTANESFTVSGGTATVSQAGNFRDNLSVADGGTVLTCVGSSPAAGQYSFSGGVYTFDSSMNGHTATIQYSWLTQSLSNYAGWCSDMGLYISTAYTDQTAANSVLGDIAKYTYSEFVWSSGVLTLVPRGTVSYTGYDAPSVQFDLNDDDYLPNQGSGGSGSSTMDDPIIVTRLRQSDQDNTIQLEYQDRGNQYSNAIAEVTDQALVDQYRRRLSGSQTAHMFADAGSAHVSAQLLLQKQYIKNTYSVTLPQQYIVLDPMDVVSLTDSYLGLDHKPVRVVEMSENDDGSISFMFEEIPEGSGQVATYTWNQGQGYAPDYEVVPGDVSHPAMFNAPPQLSNGLPQVYISVTNPDPDYGGCNIYASTDNSTYTLAGTISGRCSMGVTTTTFPAGSDPDTVNSLDVDMSNSTATLISYSSTDADSGVSLCYLGQDNGGEFVAYQTATLTGTNLYTLGTYIRRGMYGSANATHASGTVFVRCDTTMYRYTYPSTFTGNTIYLKFTSFNKFGQGEQALSGVTAYTHTLKGVATQASMSTAHLTLTRKSFTP